MAYQQAPPPDLPREALVKYLARYVSGVAISDQRLVSCEHGQVTYTVKNRKEHGRCEERTIGVSDFLSRYMQHVLPPGFTRVRSYGFLSSGNAKRREHCRELLEAIASSGRGLADPQMGGTLGEVVPTPLRTGTDGELLQHEQWSDCSRDQGQLVSPAVGCQLAAVCADWCPRRVPKPPQNSLRSSCGFAVCAELEKAVGGGVLDLPNPRDRNVKECCSRAPSCATSAPQRSASESLSRAETRVTLRS